MALGNRSEKHVMAPVTSIQLLTLAHKAPKDVRSASPQVPSCLWPILLCPLVLPLQASCHATLPPPRRCPQVTSLGTTTSLWHDLQTLIFHNTHKHIIMYNWLIACIVYFIFSLLQQRKEFLFLFTANLPEFSRVWRTVAAPQCLLNGRMNKWALLFSHKYNNSIVQCRQWITNDIRYKSEQGELVLCCSFVYWTLFVSAYLALQLGTPLWEPLQVTEMHLTERASTELSRKVTDWKWFWVDTMNFNNQTQKTLLIKASYCQNLANGTGFPKHCWIGHQQQKPSLHCWCHHAQFLDTLPSPLPCHCHCFGKHILSSPFVPGWTPVCLNFFVLLYLYWKLRMSVGVSLSWVQYYLSVSYQLEV